jgi:hypothetical protein
MKHLMCDNIFEKKSKGYKRKSIDSVSMIPTLCFRNILENTLNEPITASTALSMKYCEDEAVERTETFDFFLIG